MTNPIPPSIPGASTTIATVRCEKCNHTIPVGHIVSTMHEIASRPGFYDVGFICPGCSHFYHAAYTNDSLMALQRRIKKIRNPSGRVRLLKQYKGKFERFQIEIEIALQAEQAREN